MLADLLIHILGTPIRSSSSSLSASSGGGSAIDWSRQVLRRTGVDTGFGGGGIHELVKNLTPMYRVKMQKIDSHGGGHGAPPSLECAPDE